MHSQHTVRTTIALLLGFCSVVMPSVAGTSAGLEATPKWTKSADLKSLFATNSIAEILANAEKGSLEAQHFAGWLYYTGEGGTRDLRLAATWFERAAANGFALSQNNLGTLYANGEGVESNLITAVQWYQKAADQGLPIALNNLGRLASEDRAGLKPEQSLRFYELAAERGDMHAAFLLGRINLHGQAGVATTDYVAGLYWMTLAAENGEASAYSHLGWLYMNGGAWMPKDFAEAKKWFEKGAKVNDPHCQLSLGVYELQTQEEPDLALARDWMLKAAEQKIVGAYSHLGKLSELRDIRHKPTDKPDLAEAVKWYRLAAEMNDTESAQRLAELKRAGVNVGTDAITQLKAATLSNPDARFDLALQYWKDEKSATGQANPMFLAQSAAASSGEAADKLSDLYRTGTHVKKDPLEALRLLHLAAHRFAEEPKDRMGALRDAITAHRSPPVRDRELAAVFESYVQAVYSKASEPPALFGKRYLDGTYPKNEVAAAVWLSLAADRGDQEAAKTLQQILSTFDEQTRDGVRRQTATLEHAYPLSSY